MAIGSAYIVAMVLAGLVWLWIAAVKRPGVREPSCAGCGYPVRGLEGMTCPECGGDFRSLGIVTPTHRLMRPAVFIALWTLLLPIPAALLTSWARSVGPRVVVGTCAFTVQPLSGTFPAVQFTQTMHRNTLGGRSGQSGTSITVADTPDGQTTTITPSRLLDGVDRTIFELADAANPAAADRQFTVAFAHDGSTPLDLAELELWALSLTGSPRPPELSDDVAELAGMMQSFAASPNPVTLQRLDLVGGVATTVRHREPVWYLVALGAIWIAIYAGGIVLFMVVRRTRLRAATQGVSSSTS